MRQIAVAIAAAIAALLLLALTGSAFGHAPGELLGTLLRGSLGSRFACEGTLLKSIPLLLTGLSVAVAFRAGVWNIGGEGQFLAGALAAFLVARSVAIGPIAIVLALAVSMIAGAAWASIASLLRLWRNSPEVLTTILLNFIAIHLLGYAVNGPLQEASGKYPQSEAVPAAASLPALGGTELHAGLLIALAVCGACWFLLYRTSEGLRLRATGFNPFAARYAGINTGAQIFRAMAISGAISGLAGGIELLGVTHRLFERFASGYGYSGIAVALLAQLHPLATLASAFFFGALVTGAGELQRSAGISSTVAVFGQAIVILALILFGAIEKRMARKTPRRPAAGEPASVPSEAVP
ncbi:MAG TPA: ABC transporter permease [Thermoanaerobaculia bacterium]|nr:ABC transporter permease [Thermoanaerobaculia bacterium]